MKRDNVIAVGFLGALLGLLLLASGLNHFAAFGVVFISDLVLLSFIFKTQVGQINVHLEDDLGLGPGIVSMIPDVAISLDWQGDGKRIFADNLGRIEEAVRGRQFPIALQIGSHKATVIVDCCLDGKPALVPSVNLGGFEKFHPSTDSGRSLFEA